MKTHLSLRRVVLPGIIVLGVVFVLLGMSLFSPTPQAQGENLSFGYGLPVQQVDPTGRNSVEFIAYNAPLTATLQLYILSTPQFITTYNSLPADSWEESHLDPTSLPLVAEWQETITDTYWTRETALPPGLASGFYLLTLGDGKDVQDELLVVLSRDVLLLKASSIGDETQVVAWASRLSTSEPVSGTVVAIYDDEGQLQASGVTDADGVYIAEIPGPDPQSLIAIGAAGDGLTACGTRREWNSTSDSWWYWWDWWSPPTPRTPSHKVYLYTDRPIYRPGHTVHYKGILRHDDDGDYTPITTTQPITVSVRDARDNVLSTATLFPSNFGTISGTFTLADETGLGEYHLEVTIDDDAYRQPFKVEEYRKPDYAVTVGQVANLSYYIWGDLITVTVAADYYFGQPVAGAAVQFAFYRHSSPVWQTTGTTDEQGRWVATINTADYASGDAAYIFEATVSDDSNQTVSDEHRVSVYYAEYDLTMSLDKYGYEPGETVTVTLLAQDRGGVPVAGTPLTVTVLSWIDGAYRGITSTFGTTDGAGEACVAFSISKTGWYKLEAQGRDGRGRVVTAWGWFWVYRDGWGWGYDSNDALSISADKDSYVPGETAQLLIRSPVTGTALFSLERGRTRQQYPVSLPNPVTLITLPIEADFSPNVFVTINVFQRSWEPDWYGESTPEGRLLAASTELIVPATDKVLQVELLPNETTYRPRETITFTVQVQDQTGDPVVAEVSLGLVDEAIYALSEDLSADIHETFYGRRDNGVASYDSLHPRRYLDWVLWVDFPPEGTPPPPGGGERGEGETIRRDFPDTAYWHPGVVTDAEGRAVISLTLPDNLTRWRALARAVSMDTRVGEATTAITVTQELIVRPVLPRFLIQGDVARLRTIAHNYLPHEVTATMELSATGLVLLEKDCDSTDCLPPPVSLPPGGTATADWSAVASELGQGSVLARLRTDSGGDAVELPLPIHPFAIPEVTGRVGRVEYEITETMYVSATAIPDATSLEIRLASSIALGLLDGLEYLISYPFG